MCVMVAGNMSTLRKVTSEVAEFCVGLVLFLIYVNCIATSVRCTWTAFADYYKLYFRFPLNTCVSFCLG